MVKLNQRPFEKTFNSLFEDLFQHLPGTLGGEVARGFGGETVPVNIRETKDAYLLDVVAPGLEKSDFKVSLDKNLLTVSAEKRAEQKREDERSLKREFQLRSFSRSFRVDESIDVTGIGARYEQGILQLTLPKREEVKIVPKDISIA